MECGDGLAGPSASLFGKMWSVVTVWQGRVLCYLGRCDECGVGLSGLSAPLLGHVWRMMCGVSLAGQCAPLRGQVWSMWIVVSVWQGRVLRSSTM